MKKLAYLLLFVFLATTLATVPLFAADKQVKASRQTGQGVKRWLANLEKVLDRLNLTAEQKDLALKIAKERAKAFTKFATAQAKLRRLAMNIRSGKKVSEDEVKKALEKYYSEQKKFFATIEKTREELEKLPPKAQVVILAPGFAAERYAYLGRWWARRMISPMLWIGGRWGWRRQILPSRPGIRRWRSGEA
jgi:hypothetical protein